MTSQTVACSACGKNFLRKKNAHAERRGWGKTCSKSCALKLRSMEQSEARKRAVMEFYTAYPFATVKDCSAETGFSEPSCRRYRQLISIELRQQYKAAWAATQNQERTQ